MEKYEELQMEIMFFDSEDIITTSNDDSDYRDDTDDKDDRDDIDDRDEESSGPDIQLPMAP